MKALSIILPTILLCLCFVAWQNFDNSMREVKAREIIKMANEGPTKDFENKALEAIALLNYRNVLGHKVIVNAPLIASIYVSMNKHVNNRSMLARYFQSAINYYLFSSQQRPAYGNTWSLIAQLKIYLGQNDTDFDRYLKLAHKYGQHNFMVHVNMAAIGQAMINNQMKISNEQKEILKHHLNFGLKHRKSVHSLRKILIEKDDAYAEYCHWLEENELAYKLLNCA